MQEIDQLIKLLPAADEKTPAQHNLQDIRNHIQTYLEQHFAKELEGLNSFEALQALFDKLNRIKNYFSEVDFNTMQTKIEKKQLSFIPPSRWQELDEHSPAWALLRNHYNVRQSVDKATFIAAFDAKLVTSLPIAAVIPTEIKDLIHYLEMENTVKARDLLVSIPVSVLNQTFFPLYYATILDDDGAILDLLLAKGVDPNLVNHHGETALHFAAKYNDAKAVARLLQCNADTTKTNAEAKTALQVAASAGHVEVVRELLKNTPEGKAIAAQKTTLMHWAAAGGYPAIFLRISIAEIDNAIHKQDSEGLTPYLCAIHNGQLKAAQYFYWCFRTEMAGSVSGIKALCLAARQGHVAVFNWLLEIGANAVAKDEDGKDCLAYALENGNPEIILAACKAKINCHALMQTEIQAVLQSAYQNQGKVILEFFLSLINETKEDFPLLNYIHDPAAMVENDAKRIKELADYIYSKLQILNINGLPAEMAFKRLSYYTPRQLAQLRLTDQTLNILINDERFIKQLVTAYGLEEEYAEVCKQVTESEKKGKPSRGNFAKFYMAYLRTWINVEREVSYLAEELLHAMATGQDGKVIALLERSDHADVQNVAYPLRWAARKGHLEYAAHLIQLEACTVPEGKSFYNNGNLQRTFSFNKSALIEAAKYNRVEWLEILLNIDHVPMEFIESTKAAAARGHLAAVRCLLNNNEEMNHEAVLEALELAAKHGHVLIVTELLERIARDNSYQAPEHHLNIYRRQALKYAIENNHPAVVLALVKESTLPALEGNDVRDELREACRLKMSQVVTALLTARNLTQRNLHGVFEIAASESNLECVTLVLNDNRILQNGQLDITHALVYASEKDQTEEIFNFLVAINKAEPQKYIISKEGLENEIELAMGENNTKKAIALLCQLTPFVMHLEEKFIWACQKKQAQVIRAVLQHHPQFRIGTTLMEYAIDSGDEACVTESLNADPEPNHGDLITYALIEGKKNNIPVMLFKRWEANHFTKLTDNVVDKIFAAAIVNQRSDFISVFLTAPIPIANYLPLARIALKSASSKQAQAEISADRLTLIREMLRRWQAANLLSLHSKDTMSSFAKAAKAFCSDGDLHLDQSKDNYKDALLDICDEMLMKAQADQPGAQATSHAVAKEADKKMMLILLKNGVNQLREQKNPKIELVIASYLLISSIIDERFNDQQKLDITQAYQSFVKPWWQTCATALVCIISGAIGLVLGAAAGIGIGMLAGSWSGPGMALAVSMGALAGSVQGATLGVAAGAAVTSLVIGTAGLLAVKGFFKTSEQQLAESVKKQATCVKSSATAPNEAATPALAGT